MSVYKRTYVNANGERVKSKFYTVSLKDPNTGKWRRWTAYASLKASKKMEADIVERWEKGQAGLLDEYAEGRREPVQSALDSYLDHIKTSGRDPMYVYTSGKRLRKMAEEAKWEVLSDITVPSFYEWRQKASRKGWRGRPPSGKTLNQYRDHLNAFCKWAVEMEKLPVNPVAKARDVRELEHPDYRRAATPEEVAQLLNSVPDDRRKFYTVALYTALRRDNLKTLRWKNVHLGKDPYIEIESQHHKGRRTERVPLLPAVAETLAGLRGDAADSDRVFSRIPRPSEVRKDVESAGLKYQDEEGRRRFDLHAFRKTMTSWLEQSGVPVQVASKLLHHRQVTTTQKHYRSPEQLPVRQALEGLPKLPETK